MNIPKIFIAQTDTVPGIFARMEDEISALEIYKIKGRTFEKPLAIYSNDVLKFAQPSMLLTKFLKAFKGEALTIVTKAKEDIPSYCIKDEFVGVRMLTKNHPFIKFLEENKLTLVGTSANVSGNKTPSTIEDVEIKNIPIINLKAESNRIETSVIKIDVNGLTIIREGFNITKITNWAKQNGIILQKI